MRTPEQIKNLRSVFFRTFGPFALLAPDYMINHMANRIERQINNTKFIWEIRIRMENNKDSKWEDITPEPKFPHEYYDVIARKCKELLDKYPAIIEIGVCETKDVSQIIVFNRD
jgi:hypothetical protein